jgi:hypothetical protein
MSPIEESLLKFLSDDTLRVAVLKGEWGIGKTFFWRNFFNKTKEELSFRAYSYVSLFGAQEIGDLKRQVFSNFEMLDEKGLSKHLEKLKPISAVLKSIEIPYLNSSGPINDLIESKLIDNFLICFDDLERKEEAISGSSVLGLISQLKEEKSCKIILIYNDRELDEGTKQQINEYREKVVDLELTYRPTIDQNLSIIWPEDCPVFVSKIFHALELNNIRVMQRVRWTLEYFNKDITEEYPNLSEAFQSKCAMLTVIYHAYSSSVTLKEVLSTSYYSLLLSKDEDDKSRFEILKKLNYLPEDQDAVIAEYLNNGYVDFSAAKELLTKKNEEYRLTNINESHRQIWRKYHSNFNTPQKEFIELQERFLKEHINDLGVRDVAATVEFILELDPEVNLENLVNKSIDLFVSKVERVDRHDLHSLRMQPKIIEKIEEKLSAKTKDYTIKELFVALAGSNGWNPSDIKHLLSFSENDFYEWITKEDSADVVSLVEEFLKRFGHQNEDEKNVVERIKGALEKVKDRSPIDRCRVEYLIENRKTN